MPKTRNHSIARFATVTAKFRASLFFRDAGITFARLAFKTITITLSTNPERSRESNAQILIARQKLNKMT